MTRNLAVTMHTRKKSCGQTRETPQVFLDFAVAKQSYLALNCVEELP